MYSFIGIVAGGFSSLQTAVNARLGNALGSPYRSSFVSFSLGALFLILSVLLTGGSLMITKDQFAIIPWWAYIGGITGAIGLTLNIVLFNHIGSTQTAILPVVGQLVTSALIDQFGWFRMPIINLDLWKIIGLILLFAGACLIVLKPTDLLNSSKKGGNQLGFQVLAVFSGALVAIQTATNGQLGHWLQSPIKASSIVFLTGAIILLIVVLFQGHYQDLPKVKRAPWWGYLGGPLGALNVALGAWLITVIGAGLTTALQLVGIMIIGLVIDQFGLLDAEVRKITQMQMIGLVVLVVGVVLVEL